jgi:hypothetical protein
MKGPMGAGQNRPNRTLHMTKRLTVPKLLRDTPLASPDAMGITWRITRKTST